MINRSNWCKLDVLIVLGSWWLTYLGIPAGANCKYTPIVFRFLLLTIQKEWRTTLTRTIVYLKTADYFLQIQGIQALRSMRVLKLILKYDQGISRTFSKSKIMILQ